MELMESFLKNTKKSYPMEKKVIKIGFQIRMHGSLQTVIKLGLVITTNGPIS